MLLQLLKIVYLTSLLFVADFVANSKCCDQQQIRVIISSGSSVNKTMMNYNMNPGDRAISSLETKFGNNNNNNQQPSYSVRDVINYLENGTFNASNSLGGYALIASATSGDTNLVTLLLDHGAYVNTRDGQNSTALISASRVGNLMTVRVLVDRGGDVNVADNFGYSALLCAAENGHDEIVNLLLEKGANIAQRTSFCNCTAIILAAANNQVPVIRTLALHGADVNDRDVNGWTAIRIAARATNMASVVMLKSFNASIVDCPYPACNGFY